MIQFNLLPDIKIQYLKAKRQKHMVVVISFVLSAVSLAVLALLLTTVFGLQKKNLGDLNGDIAASSKQLKNVQDLNKILTVQNQLGVLQDLHDKKVVSSRLFTFIPQVTPANAKISKLVTDFNQNTMIISGTTDDLNTVNKYTDTLKFTKYVTQSDNVEKQAFSAVVLTAFSRDKSAATYEISLKFDPALFSNQDEVTLKVPKIITTRSEVDKPTEVFQGEGQ